MDTKTYEEKRQARIERLEKRASRIRQEGEARIKKAHSMASVIPFGQPILVGHYSERRDRNYRANIESNFRAGFSQLSLADKLDARAQAAAENTAIFSDDPAATEKLEEKIGRLEKRQEMMKKANILVRKGDREGLAEMGFSEAKIAALFTPDFAGRLGYPDYELKNNGANIRRIKARLAHIETQRADETTETETNGIRVVDNVEDNRVQIFFPGKPGADVIAKLKSNGFRWTPSLKCWQAYRGWRSSETAKEIQGKPDAQPQSNQLKSIEQEVVERMEQVGARDCITEEFQEQRALISRGTMEEMTLWSLREFDSWYEEI